jgi:hypothetical protein
VRCGTNDIGGRAMRKSALAGSAQRLSRSAQLPTRHGTTVRCALLA